MLCFFVRLGYLFLAVASHYLSLYTIIKPLGLADNYAYLFSFFILVIFSIRLFKRKLNHNKAYRISLYLSMVGLGFISFYLPMLLIIGMIQLLSFNSPIIPYTGLILCLILTMTQLYFVHKPKVHINKIKLTKNLEAYQGLRVLHLSDLHLGPVLRGRFLKKIVQTANEREVHFSCITGDLVDGPIAQYEKNIKPLSELAKTTPIFYVTGNHEAYYDAELWLSSIKNLGCIDVNNVITHFKYKGNEVVIAGSHDPAFAKAIKYSNFTWNKEGHIFCENKLSIHLEHMPDFWNQDSKPPPFFLQLSGHTHGGQAFPWSLLINKVNRFAKGMYEFQNRYLFVHQGTGFWGPTNRLFVSPLIVIHEFC